MAFWDFLKDLVLGKEEGIGKVPKYGPQGMDIYNQMAESGGLEQNPIYQQASQFLQMLMSGDMSAFEGPLMQQFEQQTIPGIAESFGGVGAGSSSGLNQALARATENLGVDLGAQRAGLMAQTLPQALNYAQAPFQQQQQMLGLDPYEYYRREGKPGILETGLGAVGRAATQGVGSSLTDFFTDRSKRYLG